MLSAAASIVVVLTWLGVSGSNGTSSSPTFTSGAHSPLFLGTSSPPDAAIQTDTPGTTAAAPPNPAASAPNLAPSAGPPVACQQAEAAVTTFQNTAGPTWFSKQQAVDRAQFELNRAYSSAMFGGGAVTVGSDLNALVNDFAHLHNAAYEQNSSAYDEVITQTNTDSQQLWTDCGAG